MADAPSDDPNVSPMRQDIRTKFEMWQVMVCAALGGTAIVGGLLFGLLLAND